MNGDRIDVIPPRAVDDKVFVHRECGQGLKRSISFLPGQRDRGVPMLAMARFVP